MPTPSIILKRPQILLTSAASASGINDGSCFFGLVAAVHPTCDTYAVGDKVMYLGTKGLPLQTVDAVYVLVEEQFIYATEI